ncbi:hypothetical protein QBC37DRAFT_378350 [Rhypophila decipiens]|uniref:C2H2-type domain-containing protein n=1 Tax=Rhypophila decipiens TaxID=261697 RepID=A0AAN7B402_9PEZI|nr:hypothetical protein QBC37DRAFT_378350 [Rhypophila decipiens]
MTLQTSLGNKHLAKYLNPVTQVRDHTISDSNHGHHLTDSYFFYDGYDWDLALQQSPVPQSCQADFRSSDQQWISQSTSPGSSLFNSTPGQDRDNFIGENWDLPTLGDIASAPLDIFNYNNFSQDNNIPSQFLVHDNALFLLEQQRALTISPSATSAAIWTANPTPASPVSTPQHLAQIDNPCIQAATGTRDSSSIQSPGARTDPSPAEHDVSRSVAFPGSRLRIERAETHRCARCNKLFFTAEGLRSHVDLLKHRRPSCRVRYSCPARECANDYADKRGLARHIKTCKIRSAAADAPEHQRDESFWVCACGKEFRRWDKLTEHHRRHRKPMVGPYLCRCSGHCSASFHDFASFFAHYKSGRKKGGRPKNATTMETKVVSG